MITLLKPGTAVTTKNGDGVVLKVDMATYDIPMYHVLLTDDKYAEGGRLYLGSANKP